MGSLGTAATQIFQACENSPILYAELLKSLNPKIKGNKVRMRCPNCGDNSAWLVAGSRTIRCDHANKCGKDTHVLSVVLGRPAEMLDGDDFVLAVKQAAGITGVSIDEVLNFEPAIQRIEADKLETIWQIFNECIRSERGGAEFDYLARRGFYADFIGSNFGAYCGLDLLKTQIDSETLRSLGFEHLDGSANEAWSARVIIPARNEYGKLIGFIGRCINGDRKDKYRATNGYSKAEHPFGLHLARRHKNVVVVEGHIDLFKLWQAGVFAVIAMGSCNISAEQLQLMHSRGIERINVFFDMDKAGRQATQRLLDTFDEHPETPELFIGELSGQAKDPDEYIDLTGVNAFMELAQRATHAHRYRARFWFSQLERDGLGCLEDGQLPKYIDIAARYLDSIKSKRVQMRAQDSFLSEVCKLSGVDRADVRAVQREFEAARRNKESGQKLRESASRTLAALREGNLLDARQAIARALSETSQTRSTFVSPEESIEEVRSFFQRISKGDLIGVKTNFRPFDENLCGARGMMLLAGQTNVGKTTLVADLMAEAVSQSDTCCFFLSCEMARYEINARLLSRISQIDWRDVRGMYMQSEFEERARFWEQTLLDRIVKNCLVVHPKTDRAWHFSVQSMIESIEFLRERTNRNRIMVIVDYLDVVPGFREERDPLVRQELICDSMLDIRHALGPDNPLICIAAVRKAGNNGNEREITYDDVMGSAYRSYCSDIVVIWNKFSDRNLYEWCDLTHDFHPIITHHSPVECDWERARKDPEVRRQIRRAKEFLLANGIGFSQLDLAKVRDGMNKGTFNLTVNYRQSKIMEGLCQISNGANAQAAAAY